jgi:hypothetical protein
MLIDTPLVTRDPNPRPRFSLMGEMIVERGTKADWDLLHHLHYKAEKLPIGPRFYKLTLYGETVGVLVTGAPKGMLRERHKVFSNIRPGAGETKLTNTQRYVWINENLRVVSRFVIDTNYRGIGAGYRMMNLVSRMEGNTFMEIQSSMSKFNYFGQKAGFRFVKPMNANRYEVVMKWFRLNFEANPQDFEAVLAEIQAKTPEGQEAMFEKAIDFYFRNSALENTSNGGAKMASRRAGMDIRGVIKGIQQIGLASPMYGIWKCPDKKGSVPVTLPLSAFDWQGPNEPLKLPKGYAP